MRFTKIDKVLIGFYQGKTKADLQTNFKDIEMSATTLYEVAVAIGARDVMLGDAKMRGGTHAVPGLHTRPTASGRSPSPAASVRSPRLS